MASAHSQTAPTDCPRYEDLVAFNSGSLAAEALESVGEHLSHCSTCLSVLETVAGDEAKEIRAFRLALKETTPHPFATDPEYLRMEERAHQLLTKYPLPAHAGTAPPPTILGQYQLLEKIGEGGMGTVYRALHTRLKKLVAIKLLAAERTLDYRSVARFNREMEAVGRLDHNHIIRATDAGEADGMHYLVMDLIDGLDLARLVRRHGPLGIADACEAVRQAACGLQCAHDNELVHRDVKPSNLLVSVRGEVKVLDLGLALLSHQGAGSRELTVTGQIMGTGDYMAPEQWEASHAVDIRADIYSLGCTLYTLLVGRPPFAGAKYASAPRKMSAHLHDVVPAVTAGGAEVPAPLQELLLRMLAKDPAHRPTTPAEVAEALQPFCRGANLAALVLDTMALPRPRTLADHPTQSADATPGTHDTGPGPKSTAVPQLLRSPVTRHRMAWIAASVGLVALALTALLQPWAWVPDEQAPNPGVGPLPGQGQAQVPAPGGWQNLLAKPPLKRFWKENNLVHKLQYDPNPEQLWVTTTAAALVRLGQTDAPAYKLHIGFRQTPWVGGVGVYFGGHPAPAPDVFRCQLISMRKFKPKDKLPFGLERSMATTPEGPTIVPHVSTSDFARSMLCVLPGTLEQLLEIEVRQHLGLVSVRWNGELCSELVSKEASDAAGLEARRGEFGIFCESSTTIVSTARYLPME
jgi:eukaryotic-like serine/threonine-protein kinase